MITPSTITKHLKTYLPIFTDVFTEKMTVLSASVATGNVLTVNVSAHGKVAGNTIVITGGTTRNILSAAVKVGSTVQFTTTYDHDLIMPSQALDDQTLTLAGFATAAWNGVHTIAGVPSRRKFIVALPTGVTVAPTLAGTEYLKENLWRGIQTVATATTNQFTVAATTAPQYPIGTVDGLQIISGFRISAAADFKRAQAVYSQQAAGKAYAFVIMTDGDIAKDKHTLNDSVAGFTPQDMKFLKIMRNFSTVIFIPTGADLSGATAQDLAYGTLYTAFLSALFGYAGESQLEQYVAVPTGDGPAEYNTAYYAHTYDWQMPSTISYQDGFIQPFDVAFRDIAEAFSLMRDDMAVMDMDVNLDVTP